VHVRSLLVAAKVSQPDTLVEPLLAPLAAEVYDHQRHQRGLTPKQITNGLQRLARSVLIQQ